ncbi:hypothetical protein JG687_00017189 [Phytophthora cactorum]|uniref:Ysc84 actin-binding domain-containing protein n=1 Tax=Phytophthora cactorum TaxID=29920 RepID=A0A8T1TPZ6_9STRA|nr:hypothetical protein JG687_00017189 [Phytophthora cactorum]
MRSCSQCGFRFPGASSILSTHAVGSSTTSAGISRRNIPKDRAKKKKLKDKERKEKDKGRDKSNEKEKIDVPPAAAGEEAAAIYKRMLAAVRGANKDHDEVVSAFKADCKQFGQGELRARVFYERLSTYFGSDLMLEHMLPQLARLIPDDKKRKKLVKVHVKSKRAGGSTAVGNFFRPDFGADSDRYIPVNFLKRAQGIAFLTVIKAGLLITAKMGTGIVIAKLHDGSWSAPSAIGTAGIGGGLEGGGELIEFMIIMGSKNAVKVFHRTQVNVGGGLSVAVGPRGLFAGISLHGAVITARSEMNSNFYGQKLTPEEILSGSVPHPRAAQCLYDAIDQAMEGIAQFESSGGSQRYEESIGTFGEMISYYMSIKLDQAKKARKKIDRAMVIAQLGLPLLETVDGVQYAPGNSTLEELLLSGNAQIGPKDVESVSEALEVFQPKLQTHLRCIKLQRLPKLHQHKVQESHHHVSEFIKL